MCQELGVPDGQIVHTDQHRVDLCYIAVQRPLVTYCGLLRAVGRCEAQTPPLAG